MVAHVQDAEVPIAIPSSCRKYISPYSNTLFLITKIIASFTAAKGKFGGNLPSRLSNHLPITYIAWSVSMLVYIELVSVVKILAPDGSVPRAFSWSSSWVLSRM